MIVPDKYWTVYRGSKYLGAITYRRDSLYYGVHDNDYLEAKTTFEAALSLFEAIT